MRNDLSGSERILIRATEYKYRVALRKAPGIPDHPIFARRFTVPGRPITRSDWIRQKIDSFLRIQRHCPDAIRVLAEGDSWFTYPNTRLKGKSLIEHLNDYTTINVVSLASPGDTLKRYPDPPNRQWRLACNPEWLQGETYDAVLISGGGNDVLTDHLDTLVRDKTRNHGRYGRQLIAMPRFRDILNEMGRQVGLIRSTVDQHIGPDRPIFMHGYSYAQSSGRQYELFGGLLSFGPWIQERLADLNIDDRDEQQDVVNGLVDEFNSTLDGLQSSIPGLVHVDVRALLGRDDWDDEIHPNAPARRRLARHFRDALVGYF